MLSATLETAIIERHPDSGGPSARVGQELRDIVRKSEHATEIVLTEMLGWCYWMPYPGVRYYSYEPWPTALARSGRAPTNAPAGR